MQLHRIVQLRSIAYFLSFRKCREALAIAAAFGYNEMQKSEMQPEMQKSIESEVWNMTDHVSSFFERVEADGALRARIDEAVACYPGSLEIRESLVEAVLLPIAAELGLPFTVEELRAYETRKKLSRIKPDTPIEEGEEDEDADFEGYWLRDRGWENDTSAFKK